MKLRLRIAVLLLLIALTVAVSGFIMFRRYVDRNVLNLRIQDVRVLTSTYLASTNNSTIEDLIDAATRNGAKLNNPIPIDPARPCYRLLINTFSPTGPRDAVNPNAGLIEETNVTDRTRLVRSLSDGSIVIIPVPK
jgi:hypothetical protein